MTRPRPPDHLVDDAIVLPLFATAPDLVDWARATFIDPDALLLNEDHQHLAFASIGVLWTNVPNARAARRIVGQCELPLSGAAGRWSKARQERQLLDWFGVVPDFLLTFDALYASSCSDAEFMALVEHELYHAGQEHDAFDAPKFRRDGSPVFGIRGHDIEEFAGVVRRYGTDPAHAAAFIEAAMNGPQISPAGISQACGTCLRIAA